MDALRCVLVECTKYQPDIYIYICVCVCVCVWDIFNQVSTRLDCQAHLYDHFPQTTSSLRCLRTTIPARGYKQDIHTYQSSTTMPHTHKCQLGRCIPQYQKSAGMSVQGQQPYSMESTMTSVCLGSDIVKLTCFFAIR